MKPVLVVQNCAPEPPGAIVDYLSQRDIPWTLVRSWTDNAYPDAGDLGALVVMGCPLSVTTYREHEFLVRLFEYVSGTVRADIPYLGICFGGQLLARVLGASVGRNNVKEIGASMIELTSEGQTDPLFWGFDTSFPAFQWHGDTFKTPFGVPNLAKSDLCANQAFRRGKQVGIQFHLEATGSDIAGWCQTYQGELVETGLNADKVIASFVDNETKIRTLNNQLLENFFRIATNHT
ncbi:MAG: type 1 glutamine amidotransferase [Candidatus Zixiibacteriota bacterium]